MAQSKSSSLNTVALHSCWFFWILCCSRSRLPALEWLYFLWGPLTREGNLHHPVCNSCSQWTLQRWNPQQWPPGEAASPDRRFWLCVPHSPSLFQPSPTSLHTYQLCSTCTCTARVFIVTGWEDKQFSCCRCHCFRNAAWSSLSNTLYLSNCLTPQLTLLPLVPPSLLSSIS